MANYPTELRYTKDHEWARMEDDDLVRVGITAHAVDQLGDVTLVDLPCSGDDIDSASHFGDIESVKAVSELISPVAGEVVEVNEELEDKPELVNDSPYNEGWMILVRVSSSGALNGLMDSDAYESFVSDET